LSTRRQIVEITHENSSETCRFSVEKTRANTSKTNTRLYSTMTKAELPTDHANSDSLRA